MNEIRGGRQRSFFTIIAERLTSSAARYFPSRLAAPLPCQSGDAGKDWATGLPASEACGKFQGERKRIQQNTWLRTLTEARIESYQNAVEGHLKGAPCDVAVVVGP